MFAVILLSCLGSNSPIFVCCSVQGTDGKPKLADFGLATINGMGGGQHTVATGTLRYMAPEIMKGTNYGFEADVFSFGIILWQLLAWKAQPYDHITSNVEVATAVMAGERPSMAALQEDDGHLTEVVNSCWANSPHDRPAFGELLVCLRKMTKVRSSVRLLTEAMAQVDKGGY